MVTTATRPHEIDVPGYRETWPRETLSAARARSLIRTALRAWDLICLVDQAALAVSELVSNSVQHTNCEVVHVCITQSGRRSVRIAVSDACRKLPQWRFKCADDEVGGRGLALVSAIADQWGVDVCQEGKTIWVELTAKDAPSPGKSP